jgi:uncharacterized membrane protein YkoI
MKKLLFTLLLATIIFSGCTNSTDENVTQNHEETKSSQKDNGDNSKNTPKGELITKEQAIEKAKKALPDEYSDYRLANAWLEDRVWEIIFVESDTSEASCDVKVDATNGKIINYGCAR